MYILALDQGTSSSRALLFDQTGKVVSSSQQEFPQYYPQPGWVEHDPNEIWSSQIEVAKEVLKSTGVAVSEIAAIGITNQRETTVIWDRATGEPVHNALVWQDRRTSGLTREWANKWGEAITAKTGLIVDAYFSASKVSWLLDNVEGLRERAERGEVLFGTVDSWLIWKLSQGRSHVTDTSNASRTMMFNIDTLDWDEELLEWFDIPRALLPEVVESSGVAAHTDLFGADIPIAGIAGDQQAALFGQRCFEPGLCKNTYGTGCFMLLNTGERQRPDSQLLSTIAWTRNGKTTYALEGSVFIGGAAVAWLRDGLGIIESSDEVEELARSVEDTGDLYFVPAFNGLGTPHWDQDARGMMVGLTRGTTRAHLARATLESIAFQVADLARAMEQDAGLKMKELRADGGASENNLLLQFQSDLLQTPVVRPQNTESTALGAAYLAGLAVGLYDLDKLTAEPPDRIFQPELSADSTNERHQRWTEAVERCRGWARS